MSESPHSTTPTRLALEPLEDREVPALGLDTTFGIGGLALNPVGTVRFEFVAASAAAPGDKSVVVGNLVGTLPYGLGGDLAVARLTTTGAADTQFGGDGLATFSFDLHHSAVAVATQSDGKVLVAGTASPAEGVPWDMFVLRLNADGSRDTGFGKNGEALLDFGGGEDLTQIAVQTDGKILVAGTTSPNGYVGAVSRLALERLNANGTPDATFGAAGQLTGAVENTPWETGGLAIQPDGKIVVSGDVGPSYTAQGSTVNTELAVLRFNANGTADATFGTAGRATTHYDTFLYAHATDVAVLRDGRFVASGGSSYGQGLLAWFGSNGALLSQEQFSGERGGLPYIDKVIAMPQGGVEVIGPSGNGTTLEYHTAPGSTTDIRVVYAGSSAASLSAGGKIVLADLTGSSPFVYPAVIGGSLNAVRLSDPGATTSPVTLVRWGSATEVPSGPVTLSADVVPLFGAAPVSDGTITFREGTKVLGALQVSAPSMNPWEAPTSVSVTLPAGDHTVTAEYSGTSQWASSRSTTTFHVGQTVAVRASLAVSNSHPSTGETVFLTATLTRADTAPPVANATVTFYDGDTVLGTAGTLLNGMATLSTSTLTAGTHSIRAVYSGDTGLAPAESAPVSVQVTATRAYTNATLALSNNALVVGQQTTLIAAVYSTSTGVTPRGMVTFYDGSTVLGSAAVSPNGTANFTTSLRLGAHTLRASYAGDATTVGSDAPPLSVTVGKATTATGIVTGATSFAVGQPVTLTATVQPVLGTAFPIGTVEFREGTTVLGSVALDGHGQAKITLTGLTGGHVITAYYLGCSTCLGSTSGAYSVTAGGPVATITTIATSALNPVFGQSQMLTARVTGNANPPTGRVEFYDGTVLLGSAALDGRGEASLSVVLNLGGHKLRTVYLGAASFTSSSSTWLNETVTKAPTTINLTTTTAGTIQAQVRTSFAGSPIGTVTFKKGTVVIGTVAVNGAGVAVFTFSGKLAPGKHQITAVYSGSSCFLDTTSSLFNLTVAA